MAEAQVYEELEKGVRGSNVQVVDDEVSFRTAGEAPGAINKGDLAAEPADRAAIPEREAGGWDWEQEEDGGGQVGWRNPRERRETSGGNGTTDPAASFRGMGDDGETGRWQVSEGKGDGGEAGHQEGSMAGGGG